MPLVVHGATVIAGCSPSEVATLYIRDVPEETAATLKKRAAASGLSLSAYVAVQLERFAARPSNEEVVERLRSAERETGPSTSDILDALHESRP